MHRIKNELIILSALMILTFAQSIRCDTLHELTSQVTVKVTVGFSPTTQTFSDSITIRNTSGSTLGSPIYLLVDGLAPGVSIQGASELGPNKNPMLKLPIPQNGLPPGGTISNFVISYVNTNKVMVSPTLRVMHFIGPLPPDPGKAGKKTLAGIDVNGNGIRDDVEIYIRVNFGKSEKEVQALNQFARASQMGLIAKTEDESIKAMNAAMRFIDCQNYATPGSQAWKLVEAISLNTPERIDAWQDHETRLSGHTFKSSDNEKENCTFDPDLLKN